MNLDAFCYLESFTLVKRLGVFGSPGVGRDRLRPGTFREKHVKVSGWRLGAKLPHHQRDLAAMVSGMVRQMLHQVRQSKLCRAKGKHPFQRFACHVTHELNLLFLDFRPLCLNRGDVRIYMRIENGIPPRSQSVTEEGLCDGSVQYASQIHSPPMM